VPKKRGTPKDHPWYWPRNEAMQKFAAMRLKPAIEPVA